jgi:cysteine-rich repeat protein
MAAFDARRDVSPWRRHNRWLLPAVVAALVACNTSSETTSSETTPVAAPTPVCGNGVREAGEECDDGNADNADACLATCQQPVVWTTSDPHLHSTGCGRYTSSSELLDQLRGQQIQVGAALVWGEGYENDSAFFTGRDDPLSTPSRILHYDLEVSHFVAAKAGHLVLLGLDSLEFSRDVFHVPQSGVPVVDWARRQPRAIVGMAHAQFWPHDGSFPDPPGGCCTPFEVVVHAVRGRLDFLSTEKTLAKGPGTFYLWKALQNAGFRVAIAGGSDWSCIAQGFDEFTPRTDAILDGPLTYENWLLAIKAGRTAAAIGVGNHLGLRVEGRRLGEEVQLTAPQDVTVTLETEGKATEIEVLVNGQVVTRVPVAQGRQFAQTRVAVSRSSWIAARSPYVLTSPVYVLVAGQPVRASPADICYLWRSVEHLTQLVTSGRLNLYDSEGAALEAYQEAVVELRRRFVESGGGACR